jgi:hypothetical protein
MAAYPQWVNTPEHEGAEERGDATPTPATVKAHATIGSVRVSIRSYYSPRLLWTAQHHAELAGKIERALAGKTPFSIEHHGYVLSSIIASVAFLEAMVNELFQDAADGRSGPDAFIAPLSEECRRLMAAWWKSTREGFLGAIEKYEKLLDFAGASSLDRSGQVYDNARSTIALRDKFVHFRPEDRSAEDEAHAMEKKLRPKNFPDNALMAGSDNAWWPDHALGHGAAVWAHRSVKALADHVSDVVGITPNYRRQEAAGWFGKTPGERELD